MTFADVNTDASNDKSLVLCARHCAKFFTLLMPFNPPNDALGRPLVF